MNAEGALVAIEGVEKPRRRRKKKKTTEKDEKGNEQTGRMSKEIDEEMTKILNH